MRKVNQLLLLLGAVLLAACSSATSLKNDPGEKKLPAGAGKALYLNFDDQATAFLEEVPIRFKELPSGTMLQLVDYQNPDPSKVQIVLDPSSKSKIQSELCFTWLQLCYMRDAKKDAALKAALEKLAQLDTQRSLPKLAKVVRSIDLLKGGRQELYAFIGCEIINRELTASDLKTDDFNDILPLYERVLAPHLLKKPFTDNFVQFNFNALSMNSADGKVALLCNATELQQLRTRSALLRNTAQSSTTIQVACLSSHIKDEDGRPTDYITSSGAIPDNAAIEVPITLTAAFRQELFNYLSKEDDQKKAINTILIQCTQHDKAGTAITKVVNGVQLPDLKTIAEIRINNENIKGPGDYVGTGTAIMQVGQVLAIWEAMQAGTLRIDFAEKPYEKPFAKS